MNRKKPQNSAPSSVTLCDLDSEAAYRSTNTNHIAWLEIAYDQSEKTRSGAVTSQNLPIPSEHEVTKGAILQDQTLHQLVGLFRVYVKLIRTSIFRVSL